MAKPSKENFYKKLRYHAGISESTNKETNQGAQGTLINVSKSNDGTSYGIVKENHHYHIKKSTLKEGHKASDFIYVSGLQNKMEYQYHTIAEAEKQRNFFIQGLNEAFSLQPKSVVSEEKKIDKVANPFDYIKETVSKGKKANKVILENTFKKSITESKAKSTKSGLMPETAAHAIRKAMGLVTEEKAISTEDSEVKEGDVLPDKTGKEKPQAPINDSNAQKIADKAMAKGSFEKKKSDSSSIAVNQQSEKLKEEASPLITDDSEIIVSQSLANMDNAAKEKPQAPINDSNAKTDADKAVGKAAGGGESLPNNAEESKESDPLDDKEDAGDEKDDISVNIDEGKALTTDDSEQKKSDEIANNNKVTTKPEAPYNSYNQPEKGQKEEKGTELKPTAKVVKEEKDLSTADSEANPKDSIANKATEPSSNTPSLIVADSEMNPEQTLANDTKTNLPNPVAEGEEVNEDDTLIYADSVEIAPDSLANEDGTNISYDRGKTQKDASYNMDDNAIAEDGEEEKLDAASAALDNLDVAVDAEKEAAAEIPAEIPAEPVAPEGDPMAGGEEVPAAPEDPMAGGEPAMGDAEMDAAADAVEDLGIDGGEMDTDPMAGGEEGGNTEETVREIKSKAGEMGEIVRTNPEVATDKEVAIEVINQVIEPFNTEEMEHGDQQKIINKVKGADEGGEGIEGEEMPVDGGEPTGDLPIPEPEVPALESANPCSECGTFEQYAESRGYESFAGASLQEVANVISGYANAFNEGINDGDFRGTAKYMTESIIKELTEYGHKTYVTESFKKKELNEAGVSFGTVDYPVPTDKNSEIIGADNLTTEEDINELGWRDIKNAASGIAGVGKYMGDKVGQKVGQAQQGMMDKVQQAGKYVGDKTRQAGQAVKGELGRMGQDVKQAGQYVGDKAKGVKQSYHKSNANAIINNIQQDAAKLGDTIAKFNAQAEKAGQQSIPVRSIITTISNQLGSGKDVNLQNRRFEGAEVREGGEDFGGSNVDIGTGGMSDTEDTTIVQNDDDIQQTTFAPQQTLGAGTIKLGESEDKLRKYVQRRLAETSGKQKPLLKESEKSDSLKKLDKMIDEQWVSANKMK